MDNTMIGTVSSTVHSEQYKAKYMYLQSHNLISLARITMLLILPA